MKISTLARVAILAALPLAMASQPAKAADDLVQDVRWLGECAGFYNATLNYPYLEDRENTRQTAITIGRMADKLAEALEIQQVVTAERHSAENYYAKQQIMDMNAFLSNHGKMSQDCIDLSLKVAANLPKK
jgi:hypothetical protein